jgi:hypothetical protein
MYRVPQELDLSSIVGQSTSYISVGKYDLGFTLGEVIFSVYSLVHLMEGSEHLGTWEPEIWPHPRFLDLINVEVAKVEVPDDTRIVISFINGLQIHLVDNSDQYESMLIEVKGETYII